MNNELTEKIDSILNDTLFIDDTAGTMRGLSILLQEFMSGNTWAGSSSGSSECERFFWKRLIDILSFTYRTLEISADTLQEQYGELEHELLDAVRSCEGKADKADQMHLTEALPKNIDKKS